MGRQKNFFMILKIKSILGVLYSYFGSIGVLECWGIANRIKAFFSTLHYSITPILRLESLNCFEYPHNCQEKASYLCIFLLAAFQEFGYHWSRQIQPLRRCLMRVVDLRSDTLTRPTPAMSRAMAAAPVGDDVFGEDPTVNRLEAMAADRMGKEAALFVASGTMGNLVSLLVHCARGEEIILGGSAHTYFFEQGGSAAVGGIHPRTLPNQPDGTLALADIEGAIRPDNVHFPRTRLIVLENTHNLCNGHPLDINYMKAVGDIARRNGLKIHVDGARIFNAAAALDVPVAKLAAEADSVSFCLSKGLSAPVGSVVCGSRAFIVEARRARKILGGGMRQAGVLAAAGIVALDEMTERLAEDHANARRLAEGLAAMPGVSLDPDQIHTNIVYFEVNRPDMTIPELIQRLDENGARMLPVGTGRIRAVTHYHISSEDIEYVLGVAAKILK
jgi:threonine aldolase